MAVFPSNDRQLLMVKHLPIKRIIFGVLFLVVLIGAGYVGFVIGRNLSALDASYLRSLRAQNTANAQQIEGLRKDLVDARLSRDVGGQAAKELQNDLRASHAEIAGLREEVTFYKSLMAPNTLVRGLQVADFDLFQRSQPREYGYHLLLTQVESRRARISGEVTVEVLGNINGEQQVLSLTEIAETQAYPLKYRFRYFQDLAGVMRLPENFVPASVRVTAKGKKVSRERTFAWRLRGE